MDDDIRGMPGEGGVLRRFHARKGLPYRKPWFPPQSHESRNAMWWLPNGITPRFPTDDPPVLR